MAAITWRNVDAPDVRDVSAAMLQGQNGINAGFDGLNKILAERKAIEEANWQQQKTNNTNAFLNEIAKYRTPEEYQAALASGELGNTMGTFGAQIDQQAARTAMDKQLGLLRDRQTADYNFDKTTQDRLNEPIKGALLAQALNGDIAGAKAGVNASALPKSEVATLLTKIDEVARKAKADARTDKNAEHEDAIKTLTRPMELANAKDTVETQALQGEVAREQQNHRAQMEGRLQNVLTVAKAAGVPVDSWGSAGGDTPAEVAANKAKLFTALKTTGIENPEGYLLGDTAAADNFFKRAAESGKYSPGVIDKVKATGRTGFDSTGDGKVGIEALNRKAENAKEDAVMEEMSRNTWHVPGQAHPLQDQKALTSVVTNLVPENDRVYASRAINKILAEGIPVKVDGKTIMVTPSQADIERAITATDDGWGWSGWDFNGLPKDFGEKMEARLKATMNTAGAKEQLAKMERINVYRLKKAAGEAYKGVDLNNPITR